MGDSGTATTRERPLIDAAQQVRHLKDRGVRFELTDEREAGRFLRESNFFFKVKTFAKCFFRNTNSSSERFGSYINLDFAYLAELTRLDHHLRETALSLTLDIEHYMKVELNRMIMDAGDDPYELMASLFDSERERKVRVLEKRVNLYSIRSKVPAVMSLSGDLPASDARSVISALASLLHLALDSLDGIDPDHTERSLSGLSGSSYTRGLVEKYGTPSAGDLELPRARLLRRHHLALQVLRLRMSRDRGSGDREGAPLPDEGTEERGSPQREHAQHARLEAEEARRLHLEDGGRGAGNRPRARIAHQEGAHRPRLHRPRPLLHAPGQERGRERGRRGEAPSPAQAIHGAQGLLLQAGRAEERPGDAQRGHGQGGRPALAPIADTPRSIRSQLSASIAAQLTGAIPGRDIRQEGLVG